MKADAYCTTCLGWGNRVAGHETTDCETCSGTGRTPVPFAELFMEGRSYSFNREWRISMPGYKK